MELFSIRIQRTFQLVSTAKEYFSAGIHCIFLELNVWCKVRLCLHGGIRHHCATIADFGQIVGGASKSSSSLRDM